MKQVAVLGLGDFGLSLAQHLKENGVSVLAVDVKRTRADLLREEIDHVVIADITQAAALTKLRLQAMDFVVVAASSPLPTSILCILRLKEMGVKHIVAKAENKDHATVLKAMGVEDIIIPEHDSARRLGNRLSYSSVMEMFEFSAGAGIMEIAVPESIAGKTLRNSGLRDKYRVQLLGIRKKPNAPLEPVPDPEEVIFSDYTMIVFGEEEHLAELRHEAEKRTD